jgi:hypothetical protein
MFNTYQYKYAANDEKVIASLKHIVHVKRCPWQFTKKSHGPKIGKGKARMGKGIW